MRTNWLVLLALLWLGTSCPISAVPPVYSLQSTEDEDKVHVFFSTMDRFRRLGVTSVQIFLDSGASAREEYDDELSLNTAKCIANSSFCYVTSTISSKLKPCDLTVTLRGYRTESIPICGPIRCPNMATPQGCHLTIVNRYNCPQRSHNPDSNKCDLPEELKQFLPDPDTQDTSGVLLSVVVTLVVIAAAAGAAAAAILHAVRQGRRARFVAYIHLEDAASGMLDDGGHVSSSATRLLSLPSRSETDRIRNTPEYSLGAVAASFG